MFRRRSVPDEDAIGGRNWDVAGDRRENNREITTARLLMIAGALTIVGGAVAGIMGHGIAGSVLFIGGWIMAGLGCIVEDQETIAEAVAPDKGKKS